MKEQPKHIREWLARWNPHNDAFMDVLLMCPKCNSWFESIDPLAPYQWETCWCGKCKAFPLMPKDDYTPSEDASAIRQEQNRMVMECAE